MAGSGLLTPRLRFGSLDSRSPEQVFAGEPAPEPAAQQVVEAGKLPAWVFDQNRYWIDPQGYQREITTMDRESVEFVIDFLFSYASRMRMAWSMEQRETFDTSQKPRRWLMTKPGVRALFERLAILNKMEEPDDAGRSE